MGIGQLDGREVVNQNRHLPAIQLVFLLHCRIPHEKARILEKPGNPAHHRAAVW